MIKKKDSFLRNGNSLTEKKEIKKHQLAAGVRKEFNEWTLFYFFIFLKKGVLRDNSSSELLIFCKLLAPPAVLPTLLILGRVLCDYLLSGI